MKTIRGPALFLAQFAGDDAQFGSGHIMRVTGHALDDIADGGTDKAANRRMPGTGS